MTEEAQACEVRLAPALPTLWAVGVALLGSDSRAVRSHQAPPAPLTVGCPPRAHNTGSWGPRPQRSEEIWGGQRALATHRAASLKGSAGLLCVFKKTREERSGTSPVVWWLRLHLPVQEVQV